MKGHAAFVKRFTKIVKRFAEVMTRFVGRIFLRRSVTRSTAMRFNVLHLERHVDGFVDHRGSAPKTWASRLTAGEIQFNGGSSHCAVVNGVSPRYRSFDCLDRIIGINDRRVTVAIVTHLPLTMDALVGVLGLAIGV
jgi:hypothetical protein